MALQYPSFVAPQPTTTKLSDVLGLWDQGVEQGRNARFERDAPDLFAKTAAPLSEFGLTTPADELRAMFANPNTREQAIRMVQEASQRRSDASDPLKQLQLKKAQLDLAEAQRGPAPTAEMRNFQFAQNNPGFADFIGGAGAQNAPAAVQEYLFYRDQATKAGETPLPYVEFKRAMEEANGGGGGEFGLTPVWGVDESGNPVLGQMNKAGGVQVAPMPDGVTFGKEPIRLDAGDRFVLLDPVTRQRIGEVPKSGDIPTGFAPDPEQPGAIAPMPGSPQAADVAAGRTKAQAALASLETKQDVVSGAIDKALAGSDGWTTGLVGSLTNPVPGTPAYDLARTLDTIKANIGFAELQTMRDNSPTGGALGAVTERELAFLQSTIASIEQAQSEKQLRDNLGTLRDYLRTSASQRRTAFDSQWGGAGGGNATPDNDPLGIR